MGETGPPRPPKYRPVLGCELGVRGDFERERKTVSSGGIWRWSGGILGEALCEEGGHNHKFSPCQEQQRVVCLFDDLGIFFWGKKCGERIQHKCCIIKAF